MFSRFATQAGTALNCAPKTGSSLVATWDPLHQRCRYPKSTQSCQDVGCRRHPCFFGCIEVRFQQTSVVDRFAWRKGTNMGAVAPFQSALKFRRCLVAKIAKSTVWQGTKRELCATPTLARFGDRSLAHCKYRSACPRYQQSKAAVHSGGFPTICLEQAGTPTPSRYDPPRKSLLVGSSKLAVDASFQVELPQELLTIGGAQPLSSAALA